MGIVPRFPPAAPVLVLLLVGFQSILPAPAGAQSLVGSRTSMIRQNEMAREQEFDFLRTPQDVSRFVRAGRLVRVPGNASYELADEVSFPYARPAVKTFLERFGRQYKAACREKLVVTSLVRPITRQPWNASHLSVHPTGMALDLRHSDRASCRSFLEKSLLTLEKRGVVEATRERWPAHYHVTVFPGSYRYYLGQKGVRAEAQTVADRRDRHGRAKARKGEIRLSRANATRYRVRRGDTLVRIAERHRSSVDRIRSANHLRSPELHPGQLLSIPAR